MNELLAEIIVRKFQIYNEKKSLVNVFNITSLVNQR